MSNIAIIGANGMLGYAVSGYLSSKGYDILKITRAEFDIAKNPFSQLESLLSESSVVINCAGIIKPQIAKNTIEDVVKVNSIFPRNLASFCKQMGMKCLHITTDCVYSGSKGRYTEEDVFDADDIYGLTKNAGETPLCMVLRTSIIGEEQGQARSLVEWARSQKGKTVNGFVNHFWNGVTTVYLAEIIENILDQYLYKPGLYHIHSPNIVSKKELLEILSKVYSLELNVTPVEAPQFCDRTLSSIHSLSSKLCTKTIQTQVHEMSDFFQLLDHTMMYI